MVTLRNTLTKVKDPTDTKTRIGTVYKVTCAECPATYVGETWRTLDCRIKEHKRSTEKQRRKQTIELIVREPLVWNLMVLRMKECF
jgi:hypothetical protein